MSIKLNRRNLLLAFGGASALALLSWREFIDKIGPRSFKGKVYGANFRRGHHLLKPQFPKESKVLKTSVAIVGAGVSGLSCAYHLKKMGITDFKVFDLEDHIGGKSFALNNSAPWGAHYLPLVNLDNKSLINFLKEAEIIKAIGKDGIPEYDELMVCSEPMEKLFIYGRMQDGIIPQDHIPKDEQVKIEAFRQEMKRLSLLKGKDGKYAFNIPMEKSSSDFTFYDNMTMKEYLEDKGWSCKSLDWYINYCCRDDFGTEFSEISAWAGIHYFAARRGKGKDLHDDSVLTWPQGNKFLVDKLTSLTNLDFFGGHLLFKIDGKNLYFYDFKKKETIRVEAEQIVLNLPQFIIAKLFNQKTEFEYAPWMVANLKIKWDESLDNSLAWDNVNYHGKGLGIVSSNHQKLNINLQENILTYYWPLSHLKPKDARKFAIKRSHESWTQDILDDIQPMIFDIQDRIKNIDIWPWGHGMIKPYKSFFNKTRKNLVKTPQNIHVAHTDLGGLSLFEEGFYRGEVSALRVKKGFKL